MCSCVGVSLYACMYVHVIHNYLRLTFCLRMIKDFGQQCMTSLPLQRDPSSVLVMV